MGVTSPRITANDERKSWSSNSIATMTQMMSGRNLWWKINTRARPMSRRHESILVTGSSRCPSAPDMWPKHSPPAKRQATLPGYLVLLLGGSVSYAESSMMLGLSSRAKWCRRHRQLWPDPDASPTSVGRSPGLIVSVAYAFVVARTVSLRSTRDDNDRSNHIRLD